MIDFLHNNCALGQIIRPQPLIDVDVNNVESNNKRNFYYNYN